jgi:hypothetical protein
MDFLSQIKEATEALQKLPTLLDAAWGVFQTPSGWFVLLPLIFWFFVNKDLSHLFDLFERRGRRRLECLDTYVSKPDVADSESIQALCDIRDAHYFKIGTGIYAERKLRLVLIALHGNTSHFVSWRHIQRAFEYIEIDDKNNISIRKMTKFENVGYWYNQVVGYTFMLVAAVVFSFSIFLSLKTPSSLLWGMAGALLALILAVFVLAQNWSAHAAKLINKELHKLSNESSS